MIAVDIVAAVALTALAGAMAAGSAGVAAAQRLVPGLLVWTFSILALAAVLAGQATGVLVAWPFLLGLVVDRRRTYLAHPVRGSILGGALLLLGLGVVYAERLGPELVPSGARPSLLAAELVALALLVVGLGPRPIRRRVVPGAWIAAGLGLYAAGLVFGRLAHTYRTSVVLPGVGELVVAEPARALVVIGAAFAIAERLAVWRRLRPHPDRLVVVLPLAAAIAAALGIAQVSGDLGGAMVTGLCLVGLAAALISRAWPAVVGGAGLVAAGALSWCTSARARGRIDAWIDPDRLERGSQQLAGVFALADGGWFGTGFGRGEQLWSVPQVASDYAVVGLGLELGVAGVLALVVGVAVIVVGGARAAMAARTPRDAALPLAIVALLGFQALVNLMGVTLTAPLTGVPYPFVSSGGVFTITSAVLVRVLLTRPLRESPAVVPAGTVPASITGGGS